MASEKISSLPSHTLNSADIIPVAEGGANYGDTVGQIETAAAALVHWSALLGDLTETQVIPFDGPTPGTPDTFISRVSPGIVAIGTISTPGDYSGALSLNSLGLGALALPNQVIIAEPPNVTAPSRGLGATNANSANSNVLTLNINVNDCVIIFANGNAGPATGVTDNGSTSNTYIELSSNVTGWGNQTAWVCIQAKNSATTVTVAHNAGDAAGYNVSSGATFINVQAVGETNQGTSLAGSPLTGTIITSGINSLVISGFSGNTWTALSATQGSVLSSLLGGSQGTTIAIMSSGTVLTSGTSTTNSATYPSGYAHWNVQNIELYGTYTSVLTILNNSDKSGIDIVPAAGSSYSNQWGIRTFNSAANYAAGKPVCVIGGAIETQSWVTISGSETGFNDTIEFVPPSADPYMLGIWCDVASGIIARGTVSSGNSLFLALEQTGGAYSNYGYTFAIQADGTHVWNASTNTSISTWDTGISRTAAGTLAIGNGTAGDASGILKLKEIVLTDFGSTPTSSSSGGTAGTVGEIVQHSGVLYFCSATGAAGIATWNVITMTPSA